MNIIGIDYSGARSDRQTWVAEGVLDGPMLRLEGCRRVSREELSNLLAGGPSPAVAALDFPFSVPHSFAQFWQPEAVAMPDLWRAAAAMDLDNFLGLRDQFVDQHGEPRRLAEAYHPESYSSLHLVNPNMVPMTFRGMQMLHRLWPLGCQVPPLPGNGASGEPDPAAPLLLETMPGAALKALRLPHKGYKNGSNALALRRRILDGLLRLPLVQVAGLDELREQCLVSHDCLDAVVAAVVAALWVRDRSRFRRPAAEGEPDFDPMVMLEGWLYAPVFVQLD